MSKLASETELTYEATSRTLKTPKGELHYHVAGDGPPVLLLHGSGPGVSGWANFRGNLPTFAEHFTTLVLDMPGFGTSYSSEGNPMLAAPGAVLDFLDGLEIQSLPVLGNSMGGAIASGLAAEHPDRVSRLVTIGGVGMSLFSPSPPEGIKLLVQFVEDPTRERLVTWMESMVYDTAILTEEFVEMRWQAANNPAALVDIKKLFNYQTLAAMTASSGATSSLTRLTKIQAPTLVTWGRDDRVTPLDSCLVAMRSIRLCELHVFYNCGHWVMIERKDEFENVVLHPPKPLDGQIVPRIRDIPDSEQLTLLKSVGLT
jgi:pimeloyl-ACP methyl ester carboxylesterase